MQFGNVKRTFNVLAKVCFYSLQALPIMVPTLASQAWAQEAAAPEAAPEPFRFRVLSQGIPPEIVPPTPLVCNVIIHSEHAWSQCRGSGEMQARIAQARRVGAANSQTRREAISNAMYQVEQDCYLRSVVTATNAYSPADRAQLRMVHRIVGPEMAPAGDDADASAHHLVQLEDNQQSGQAVLRFRYSNADREVRFDISRRRELRNGELVPTELLNGPDSLHFIQATIDTDSTLSLIQSGGAERPGYLLSQSTTNPVVFSNGQQMVLQNHPALTGMLARSQQAALGVFNRHGVDVSGGFADRSSRHGTITFQSNYLEFALYANPLESRRAIEQDPTITRPLSAIDNRRLLTGRLVCHGFFDGRFNSMGGTN